MKKLNININGKEIEAFAGQTILEAARDNGIFIPTLCEDGRTEIYGACGVCVVEAEGNPKLLKACATVVDDGMIISTDTPRVLESRKTMLELLLTNHTGDCRPPCSHGCPAGTDCQGYVGLVANGEAAEAYRLIMDKIPLPASIGRVCPHPCETECRRKLVEEPIAIAHIKRYCGDFALRFDHNEELMPEVAADTGKSVAVIGGGPYGLSLAYFLRILGHNITIYEAMPAAGGMLRYGIPEYRLPKAILDAEIKRIENMGVVIKTNVNVGRDISFESIRESYDAVFVGIGAWVSTGTGAAGEDLPGVIGGIELLSKLAGGKVVYLGKRVAVVGGGNTAMDACRTAVRLGASEVYCVYRRTKNEMPAEEIEITEADEEGVIFKELTNPIEIIPGEDGRAAKMKLQIMELGEPDESGRRSPVPVKGKTEMLSVDTVVLAVGQAPDPASLGIPGLELTRKKGIVYNPRTYMTSIPGVFAGGDCGNDKVSIAVEAIADAKHSASVIDAWLFGEEEFYEAEYCVKRSDITERTFEERERMFRPPVALKPADERKGCFEEVMGPWDDEDAIDDAMRCLECGCGDYFECKLIEYARLYKAVPERFKGDLSVAGEDGSLPPPDADKNGHKYIERDEGKCILCGLCVRVCDEVCGAAALGLASRGFDTVVTPAFSVPLQESGCVSCGLCVSACPTGAMRERLKLPKSVPLDTDSTDTTCAFCSLGCQITIENYGDLLVKTNPSTGNNRKGLICGRGKFGFAGSEETDDELGERIYSPFILNKSSDVYENSSWYDAFVTVAKKAQKAAAVYGPGSVAVSVSDRLTNEEAYAAGKLASSLGASVFSFNNRVSAAEALFGYTAAAEIEELLHTDYILLACVDYSANPVLSMTLKRAADSGVKIVSIITDEEEDCDVYRASFGARIKEEKISTTNSIKLLSDIEASLKGNNSNSKASKIADDLKAAKKAMIVYQRNVMTPEAADLLCRISVLSGHQGKPRRGIFEVLPKSNSRGISDLGMKKTPADILACEDGPGVKVLLVFGEDPAGQIAAAEAAGGLCEELKAAKKMLSGLDFLAVFDTHNTLTAKQADVVVPTPGSASVAGTFTNTEGRLLAVTPVLESFVPYDSWQICREIAGIAGMPLEWENESDISREMNDNLPVYKYAVIGEAQAGSGNIGIKDLEDIVSKTQPAAKGKLVSPLPASDNLTRGVNRKLGVSVYGD